MLGFSKETGRRFDDEGMPCCNRFVLGCWVEPTCLGSVSICEVRKAVRVCPHPGCVSAGALVVYLVRVGSKERGEVAYQAFAWARAYCMYLSLCLTGRSVQGQCCMGAPGRVLTWVLLFVIFVLRFGCVEAVLGCHIVVMVSSSAALRITISLNGGRVKVG